MATGFYIPKDFKFLGILTHGSNYRLPDLQINHSNA